MDIDLLRDLLVILYHYDTGDRVVVSAQIFGRTVCYDVRAKCKRFLEIRCQECVVHNSQRADSFCDLGNSVNIRHLHHRIGRCLNEKHLGILLYCCLYRIQI